MLELRELRNFVVVAERLNITTAAREVNLSQPALSRQIQALERKLGTDLLERVGKRLVLTADGADFALKASELLERATDLMDHASKNEMENGGKLRIGASPQTISWLLSPAMAIFKEAFSQTDLVVSEGNNDELVEMVELGAAHMVIANLGINNVLAGQKLFDAQLFAILPPNHQLSKNSSISMSDIADDPMLVMSRGFLTRHLFEQTVTAHGIRPRVVLESESTHTLAALAGDGHGVAIVSSSARDIARISDAVPIYSNLCQTSAEVSALWNPKRYRPKSFSRFLNILVSVCNDKLSGSV